MILKFIFQIAAANFKVKFKHIEVHRFFSCVVRTRGGWEWEKFEIFLGMCQYLLFISFLLMGNTNSHRTACS